MMEIVWSGPDLERCGAVLKAVEIDPLFVRTHWTATDQRWPASLRTFALRRKA